MPKSSTAAAERDDQASTQTGRKPADKFHEGPVHVSIWEKRGSPGALFARPLLKSATRSKINGRPATATGRRI